MPSASPAGPLTGPGRAGTGPDLVIRARRAVLPDGTRPAAVRVTGGVGTIAAVGPYDADADGGAGRGAGR